MSAAGRLVGMVVTALLASGQAGAEVTLTSLLEEMTDFGAVARWPQPEFTCKQASSYDRATMAPDKPGLFANNDQNQFIRTETNQGRTEKVMLDADGPGCIVRFWLTTDQNKKGTLRVYLDGAAQPALEFPAYDLLSGDLKVGPPLIQPHPGYQPDGNGGNTLYLPIPYGKHCKVTWEGRQGLAITRTELIHASPQGQVPLALIINADVPGGRGLLAITSSLLIEQGIALSV